MAKPKQMVPKDDAQKMDAPQEQPEQQDLEAAPEADAAPEAPAADAPKSKKKAKKHRALVNMHIPGGTVLVQGQDHELSKSDHAHLDTHFPDSKHHIVSEQ